MNLSNREPVVLAQLFQTALVAILGVVVSFGAWDPTPTQVGALTTLYVAIAGIVTYVLRGKVYAPANVVDVDIMLPEDELPPPTP